MTKHALLLDLVDGRGVVILDGHDVSAGVRSLNLEVQARQAIRVVLEPVVHTIHATAAEATVTIPHTTAQLLTTLGWTPPADAEQPTD